MTDVRRAAIRWTARMTLALRRPTLLWMSGAVLALLTATAALVVASGGSHRSSVYAQLQRPTTFAAATVGPGPVATTVQAGSYRLAIRLEPNRSSIRDRLSVAVDQGGQPVAGARVAVTYSMPSMGMTGVYTGRLPEATRGAYTARQPVFGMPGSWQLSFSVTPPHGAPVAVVINDRMIR
jgi:hypothetical protein